MNFSKGKYKNLKKFKKRKENKKSKWVRRVCKAVTFALIEHRIQSTASICTSLQFIGGCGGTPNVDNAQKEYPNHVHEVPIKNCLILSNTTVFCRAGKLEQTHNKIQSTNNNVPTVETSGKVEGASKNRVTEGKRPSSVFKVLTYDEQKPQKNGVCQLKFTKGLIPSVECMFCSVRSKVRPQKKKGVCFRKSSPMNRNHAQRRPTHPQLNGRHLRPM